MRLVGLVALLSACSGTDDPDGTVDTGEPAPFFTFKSDVPVTRLTAEIREDAVQAHQATNTLLAATRLLAADEKVQDELRAYGNGGFRGAFQCWERPQFPRWTFTLAFAEACAQFDLSGAAGIERHSTQRLLFNFQDFTINGRELGGTLGLDTDGAFDEPQFFVAYATDADNPDDEVPVGVTLALGQPPVGISLDSGAAVSFANTAWSFWGNATLSGDAGIVVTHGAATAEETGAAMPTGANVLRSSLDWLECRCPTSGVMSQPLPITVDEVVIDIDDLEEEPDNVDDPNLAVPVEFEIDGRAILDITGCGEYDVTYESQAVDIVLDKQLAFAELQFLCETRTINDTARCTALQQALLRNSDDLVAQVSVEDLLATANEAVTLQFDTNWCQY